MLTAFTNPERARATVSAPYGKAADADVVRGSVFDLRSKLLPDAISQIDAFEALTDMECKLVGQIQARTFVNLFAALERAVDLDADARLADYSPADGIALASDESESTLARQMLFRRMDRMLDRCMPAGYQAVSDLDGLARQGSSWGIVALALSVEYFKQVHHDACSAEETDLSPMFRNAFLRKQTGINLHTMIAEIELILKNGSLSDDSRDAAVDGFIELIEKLDRTLQAQAALDTRYFAMYCARVLDADILVSVEAAFRKAYRRQYLFAGMTHPRFAEVLNSLVTDGQAARIRRALDSLDES